MNIKVQMGETKQTSASGQNDAALENEAQSAEPWIIEKERLLDDRDRLVAEKAELEDLLRRRQAEFDNFRKRVERERGEVYEDATMRAVFQLLPVLDDFERALAVAPAAESSVSEYAKGITLIHQQFVETLGKLGLKTFETVGKEFDPNLHHAVQKVETPGVETDMVLEQYQKGYFFKEKLLRPAMVKVSVKG